MADPLSLTATIASLIVLGANISLTLSNFIESTRSASSEIHALSRELTELCILLGKLEGTLCHVADPRPVLDSCMESFKALEILLKAHRADAGDGIWMRGWRKVRWTMKEKEVGGLRRELEAHKLTLNITLVLATHTQNKDIIESSRMIESTMYQIKDLITTQLRLVHQEQSLDPPMGEAVVDAPAYPNRAPSIISDAGTAMEEYLNRASLFLSSRSASPAVIPIQLGTIDGRLDETDPAPITLPGVTPQVEVKQPVCKIAAAPNGSQRLRGPRPMTTSTRKADPESVLHPGRREELHPRRLRNLADGGSGVANLWDDDGIRIRPLRGRRTVSEQKPPIKTDNSSLARSNSETLQLKKQKESSNDRLSSKEFIQPSEPLCEKSPIQGKRMKRPESEVQAGKDKPDRASREVIDTPTDDGTKVVYSMEYDVIQTSPRGLMEVSEKDSLPKIDFPRLGRSNSETLTPKEPEEISGGRRSSEETIKPEAQRSEKIPPRIPKPPVVRKGRKKREPEISTRKDKPERVVRKNLCNGSCSEFGSNIATCCQELPNYVGLSTTYMRVDYASDAATYCPSVLGGSIPSIPAEEGKPTDACELTPAVSEPSKHLGSPSSEDLTKPALSQLTTPPSERLCTSCNTVVTLDDLIWGSTFLHRSCLVCDTCQSQLSINTGFFREDPVGTEQLGVYCIEDFLRRVLPRCSKCKVRGVRDSPRWWNGSQGRAWMGRQFVMAGGGGIEGGVVKLLVKGGKYLCKGCWNKTT